MLLVCCGTYERTSWAQQPAPAAAAPAPSPEELAAAIAGINKAMEIKTADTAAFINNKLNNTKFDVTTRWYENTDGQPVEGIRVQQTANVRGCTIATTGKYWNTRDGEVSGDPYVWNINVFASRLLMTSSSVKLEELGYGDQALYSVYLAVRPRPEDPPGNQHFSIYINDKDMAKRLLNAFAGLGKMCGAKDEAY